MTDDELLAVLHSECGTTGVMPCFCQRTSDWLFHKDVNTTTQAPATDLVVEEGRSGNDGAIDLAGPVLVILDRGYVQLGCSKLTGIRRWVSNTDEIA